MDGSDWHGLVDQLRGIEYRFGIIEPGSPVYHIEFDVGLTDDEAVAVESRFGFRFPPDLRAFLKTALPLGPRFPNWRDGDAAELQAWLDLPRQGILFDIEHSGFWLPEWESRPDSIDEAIRIGSEQIAKAPRLIPIFSHRMIPNEPYLVGNPVLSVHQTDIIYYGFDLTDYFRHEFGLDGRKSWPQQTRPIRFWDRWAG